MALLELEGIRRSFGGLVAVDGISLTIAAGQIKHEILRPAPDSFNLLPSNLLTKRFR